MVPPTNTGALESGAPNKPRGPSKGWGIAELLHNPAQLFVGLVLNPRCVAHPIEQCQYKIESAFYAPWVGMTNTALYRSQDELSLVLENTTSSYTITTTPNVSHQHSKGNYQITHPPLRSWSHQTRRIPSQFMWPSTVCSGFCASFDITHTFTLLLIRCCSLPNCAHPDICPDSSLYVSRCDYVGIVTTSGLMLSSILRIISLYSSAFSGSSTVIGVDA